VAHGKDEIQHHCYITSVVETASMLAGSLVTTAWRLLRLRMEERPPDMAGNCEYIEQAVADKRQGVVLPLGVWAWV